MLNDIVDIPDAAAPYRISVFRPDPAAAPRPAVILLQAGEWFSRAGADELGALAKLLTASGFALVALPCPVGSGAPFATLTRHIATRIGSIVRQSAELGLDSGRLYLAGFGPGAGLSVALAAQPDLLKAAGLPADALRGVIAVSGLYDLSAASVHAPLKAWLGTGQLQAPAELISNSPLYRAASGVVGPPMLLAFAEREPFQLDEHAKRLYASMLRRRWPVRLALVPGATHADLLSGIGARRTVREPGTESIIGSYPDLLGPSISVFLEELESHDFARRFQKAWPQGWPTSAFCPDYTMSETLPQPAVRWQRDIPYVEDGDALQRLDIQVPEARPDAVRPVLFYVHGGGWRGGSKRMVHGLAELAAAQDMVLVAVDYRLAPAVKIRELAEDVVRALAWVRRNIRRYGGDPEKLVLIGVSAGAHLVALLGTDPDLRAFPVPALRGVIAISGIYDLEDFAEPGVQPSRVGQAFAEPGSPVLRRYSPAHLAQRGTPLPPFLITFTDSDLPYLDRQALQFFDRLGDAGADCSVRAIADRDHFNQTVAIGRSVASHDDTLGPAIVEFLDRLDVLPVRDPG